MEGFIKKWQEHSFFTFLQYCTQSGPYFINLFFYLQVVVLTIISLIMFFVLSTPSKEQNNKKIAVFEVGVVELVLYIITTMAVIVAMLKMRNLKYERKLGKILIYTNCLCSVCLFMTRFGSH